MKPYKNRLEYFADIRRLAELALEWHRNGGENAAYTVFTFRNEIKERAGKTDFFIPLEYVIRAFSMSEAEAHLLLTLFMYENDGKYREEFMETMGIVRLTQLALEMLAAFFCGGDASGLSLYGFADNILRVNDKGEYALKNEITCFIFEPGRLIERSWLEFYYPGSEEGGSYEPIFDEGVAEGLSLLVTDCLHSEGHSPCVIAVTGRTGGGRSSLIRQAAVENGLPVLFVDCRLLTYGGDTAQIADEIRTECMLTGGLVCFRDIDAILVDGERLSALLWGVRAVARPAFATSETGCLNLARDYDVVEYALPLPSVEVSVKLWEAETRAVDIDAKYVAEMFRLTPLQIKQAVRSSYSAAVAECVKEITQAALIKACRDISTRNIGALGRVISPSFTWEDLILPKERKEELRSAVERVRFGKMVFGDWGFADKMPYGAGVHILLHGPSGTGKTMAARVIAGELGLPVYQIDMASVVSKYIGETEKNLGKIFEEGENSNSILFFDEADALFGKRTEIKDAHDRHANLQVSFLLQKIEEYKGVVILATNFAKNFDEAFKRRFHFIIGFSMPDKEHRRKIWESAFPPETPVEKGIDFEYLSELAMSGSGIKNAAVSSAFYAAAGGKPIGMRDILRAVKDEVAKNGWSFTEEFFEE